MKIRKSFVTNSSSSSFIVIGTDHCRTEIPWLRDNIITVPTREGEYDFGWQQETYCGFADRLNFAYLQTTYSSDEEIWFNMLEEVIREELDCEIVVDDSLESLAYIDHQSNSGNDANIEMFENKDSLRNFLFASDSKIVCDNDNH